MANFAEKSRDRAMMSSFTKICMALLAAFTMMVPAPALAQNNALPSLIDASRTASLSIEKSAGDPLTQYGDPSNPAANLVRTPLEGIGFQIQQVRGIDLTTNDGWLMAESLEEWQFFNDGELQDRLGTPLYATTGADGVAHFDDLPLGLYFVTEDHKTAQSQNLSLIAPMLIALPMTSEDSNAWIYDVQVRAKDQLLTANKSSSHKCAAVGDTIKFGISGTLPAPNRDGEITNYAIADPLPQGLQFIPNSSALFVDDLHNMGHQLKMDSADFTEASKGATPSVELTKSGLSKVATRRLGNPGITVTWIFEAKVMDQAAKNTPIRNRAYVIPPGYPEFNSESRPGVETNETILRLNCDIPPVPIVIPVPDPENPTKPPSIIPGNTPLTPATPDQPIAQDQPQPAAQDSTNQLAETGASIFGLLGIALLLISLGVYFTSRKEEKEA